MSITQIITHKRPHADELIARMLLRRFPQGEEKFPGVASAKTSYLTTGELQDGRTWKDFPDTIFLGCGGGPFDEHKTSKKERVEGESCVTLVAKELGLDTDKGLEKILYYIRKEDLGGSKVKYELPTMIKLLHASSATEQEIEKWAEDAYFAIYEEELREWNEISDSEDAEDVWRELKKMWRPLTFESAYETLSASNYRDLKWWRALGDRAIYEQQERFDKAGKEFDDNAKIERIRTDKGRNINIAVIESDNEEINKYARFRGIDVVVQFQSGGKCFITTSQRSGVDLSYAFVLLRLAEQHFRGGIKINDEDILSKEGFVDGVPCWYLFHNKKMGFNGSLTTTDVEASRIPREKIVECIKEGIKREEKI